MSQDFASLYQQLGLHPGCSLEELKRAYRVRVAELHPDRHVDQADSSEAHLALTQLTALYSGAIRFHRIHGRLPGAAPRPASSTRARPEAASASHATHAASASRPSVPSREPAPGATPKIAVVSVLALVVVLVVLHWSDTGIDKPVPNGAVADASAGVPHLELGMLEADVIAIQGAPVRVQDGVWNYGSSWVRFEDGHLVDWASEPPNRLRAATARPVVEEESEP